MRTRLGHEHAEVAKVLNNIGVVYHKQLSLTNAEYM